MYKRKAPTNIKKVVQFDLNGNKIAEYNSVLEAALEIGIESSNISTSCKKDGISAGGYIWRHKTDVKDQTKIPKHRTRIEKQQKPVVQFDLEGKYIREFNSAIEASRITGVVNTSISGNCRGVVNTAGKYVWSHKDKLPSNYTDADYRHPITPRKTTNKGMSVICTHKDNGNTLSFTSLRKTAEYFNVSPMTVRIVLGKDPSKQVNHPLFKGYFLRIT